MPSKAQGCSRRPGVPWEMKLLGSGFCGVGEAKQRGREGVRASSGQQHQAALRAMAAKAQEEQSGAAGACWAHNPEVDGSKPSSAKALFSPTLPGTRAFALLGSSSWAALAMALLVPLPQLPALGGNDRATLIFLTNFSQGFVHLCPQQEERKLFFKSFC